LAVSDSLLVGFERERTTSDSLTVSDSLSNDVAKTVGDTLSFADTALSSIERGLVVSDTVAVSDQNSVASELGRLATDAIATTDALNVSSQVSKYLSDAVTVTEDLVIDQFQGLEVQVSDFATLVDQLQAVTVYNRSGTDAVGASDLTSAALELGRVLSDSFAISDLSALDKELSRTGSDTLTVSDQNTADTSYVRGSQDALAISDQILVAINNQTIVDDVVDVTDFLQIEVSKGVSDTVSVVDQITFAADLRRNIIDAVAFSDQILVSTDSNRVNTDAVSLTDTVAIYDVDSFANDVISLTDGAFSNLDFLRDLADGLVVWDDCIVRVLNDQPALQPQPVGPVKIFRYLQTLSRGDLCIRLSDQQGQFSPAVVYYTLFRISGSGAPLQVGGRKKAVKGPDVGEFYVTGNAGEQGQPGQWVVKWEFQRTYLSSLQTIEQRFQVVDAVAVSGQAVPGRTVKFGWE
jgi:hypothetical protein